MKLFYPIPIILLITLLTETGLEQGQWPEYGIYRTAGTIRYLSAKGGAVQVIHKGNWLYAGDRIQLADETSDIILFTRDSNYIELKGFGIYSTHDLETMVHSPVPDDITARYLSLLWEAFRSGSNDSTAGPAGGVSRGKSFMLSPAGNYRTSLDQLLFRWHRIPSVSRYRLTLRDTAGATPGQPAPGTANAATSSPTAPILAFDSIVRDTQLVVKVTAPLFYGHSYKWSLEGIRVDNHRQQAATGMTVLVDEAEVLPIPPSPPGIDTLLSRAQFLELVGCTLSANSVWLRLVSDDPTDTALQTLYREFRRRNGLE